MISGREAFRPTCDTKASDRRSRESAARLAQRGIANISPWPRATTILSSVSGANFGITPADIEAEEARIAAADIVLCQLEIPMDCVLAAARLAKKHARPFVLNPAPRKRFPPNCAHW